MRADFVTAIEAKRLQSEEMDARPYLHDVLSDRHLLLDSGSQVTAYPPDPGDKPDPHMKLRAVNGSRLNCYGYKDVEIKIGRKKYDIVLVDGRKEYDTVPNKDGKGYDGIPSEDGKE